MDTYITLKKRFQKLINLSFFPFFLSPTVNT